MWKQRSPAGSPDGRATSRRDTGLRRRRRRRALRARRRHRREHWTYGQGPIESQPTYADGIVYFTSGENRIYAVDAHKGTWKWQYDRESPESFTIRGYAAPLVVDGRVYAGFSDGYLACLSAATGDVIWARSLAGEATRFMDVDSTPRF